MRPKLRTVGNSLAKHIRSSEFLWVSPQTTHRGLAGFWNELWNDHPQREMEISSYKCRTSTPLYFFADYFRESTFVTWCVPEFLLRRVPNGMTATWTRDLSLLLRVPMSGILNKLFLLSNVMSREFGIDSHLYFVEVKYELRYESDNFNDTVKVMVQYLLNWKYILYN